MSKGPYRNGVIHVCEKMCSTCIFRPGNLMDLEEGRVEAMVAEITEKQSCIPCHQTLDGKQSVCHGQFKLHSTIPLRLAQSMSLIRYTQVKEGK